MPSTITVLPVSPPSAKSSPVRTSVRTKRSTGESGVAAAVAVAAVVAVAALDGVANANGGGLADGEVVDAPHATTNASERQRAARTI